MSASALIVAVQVAFILAGAGVLIYALVLGSRAKRLPLSERADAHMRSAMTALSAVLIVGVGQVVGALARLATLD